jgi:hypothetical protein
VNVGSNIGHPVLKVTSKFLLAGIIGMLYWFADMFLVIFFLALNLVHAFVCKKSMPCNIY